MTDAPTAPEESAVAGTTSPIIFFDGVCGLCNKFIDFVLPRDRDRVFLFAPLQGETAAEKLTSTDVEQLNSVVYLDEQGTFRGSTAVARIMQRMGGGWRLLGGMMRIVPTPIRDFGYKVVAKNRYRLFGKKEACRMPTPEERSRFLP